MTYKVQGSTFKLNGDRIELRAHEKLTGVRIISHVPKDDKRYLYIGQAPKSNYLDIESPKINLVTSFKGNPLYLQTILENLNAILRDNFYAEDIAGPKELSEAIQRQKNTCLLDLLTLGQHSRNEFNQYSKKFVIAFNQRRHKSIMACIKFLNSKKKELAASKLSICIPRSFPAYIAVSKIDGDMEPGLLNDLLFNELQMNKFLASNPIAIPESDKYVPTPSPGIPGNKRVKRNSIQPFEN